MLQTFRNEVRFEHSTGSNFQVIFYYRSATITGTAVICKHIRYMNTHAHFRFRQIGGGGSNSTQQ